jgi:hypothetical protein
MTSQIYLPARERTCAVLRAIADGATKVRHIQARHPEYTERQLRTTLTKLRNLEMIETVSAAATNAGAGYRLTVASVERAIDELSPPRSLRVDFSEIQLAMPMPASVRQVLDGQHGVRVVTGRAGLNAP